MPKLQQIKRNNGSVVHFVNLPLEFIEELGWKKGEELEIDKAETSVPSIIIFKREGGKDGDN